jgi:DNA repair exonuclease SbcCD ATPase subunit
LHREEDLEDLKKEKEAEIEALKKAREDELKKWQEEIEALKKERDELQKILDELRARKPELEKLLQEQKDRNAELEARKDKEESELDSKAAASVMSRMRSLTKGYFKDFTPPEDIDNFDEVRGVDFSFNGLKYFISCKNKIIKYQKNEHDKTLKYEKVKEIDVQGV